MKQGTAKVHRKADAEEVELQQLPEGVIQHILSHLKPNEAAEVGVLSKAMYNAWSLQPILKLEFDDKYAFRKLGSPTPYSEVVEQVREEFLKYAKTSLGRYRRHDRCLEQLHLTIGCNKFFDPSVFFRRLLREVDKAPTREIRFCYAGCGQDVDLDLRRFLECKALAEVEVQYCKLMRIDDAKETIRCGLLKRLILKHLHIDDITLEKISTSCPLIQTLQLFDCYGLKKAIKVLNLDFLKDLEIHSWDNGVEEVEVNAPSLESFSCVFYTNGKRKPKLTMHHQCSRLKKLELRGLSIEGGHLFLNLPALECLSAMELSGFERLEIMNKFLKSFTVRALNGPDRGHTSTMIDAPNLVSFVYSGQELPRFENSSGSRLHKCDLNLWYPIWDTAWFISLKQLLKKLIHAQVSLTILSNADSRLTPIQPPNNSHVPESESGVVGVEKMSVWLLSSVSPFRSKYSILLQNLFWTCQPKTMDVGSYLDSNRGFINYLCERLIDARNNDPGNHNKFGWENHFMEASVDVYDGSIAEVPLVGSFDSKTFLASSSQGQFNGMKISFRFKWRA